MSAFHLDFRDTATAFADKSDAVLKEKYRMFKMMSSPFLSGLGTGAARFALSIGLPIDAIVKRTVFEHFCGGETIEESQPTVDQLGAAGIGTILDYSVEGRSSEDDFDATTDEIIRTIHRAKGDDDIPFAVFKMSGIAPLGTLERMSSRKKLDAKSQMKCESIHRRVERICDEAAKIGQPVFIDAEETWIQDAIDRMADEMMEKHNRGRVLIYNTIQLYRKDRLQFLRESRKTANAKGYMIGMKLVRGAYMEKERERAAEMGYESPIQPDKESTDADYDAAVDYCLDHLDEISFVAGTHNDESTYKLAERMHREGIANNHPHIYFSQLYGMSDNLSYVLAKHGYNVSKYVPYGPVRDTLPYLIRRAEENTSTAGQVSRELVMIKAEMQRRGIS
ncbi:MAG TPA: proline dehydrogenase family protein [Pyrinomonadaceae bacterium]|nr:proline dehydrogenase family protein [Pyrinomonadaceae bacterium]